MSLPTAELTSVEFLLVAGRAVFLLFSFVLAAFAFTSWRRATQAQTDKFLSQTNIVLQRLASLEARVDATKITISQLGDRLERPAPPVSHAVRPATRWPSALAKGGASREELMAGCGLSLAEAELVQRLHGSAAAVRA